MARFVVTVDFPTPPFPLATTITRVVDVGESSGDCFCGPGRSWPTSACRCSCVITPRFTSTCATPGSSLTFTLIESMIVSRSGHPLIVRSASTSTDPSRLARLSLLGPGLGRSCRNLCLPLAPLRFGVPEGGNLCLPLAPLRFGAPGGGMRPCRGSALRSLRGCRVGALRCRMGALRPCRRAARDSRPVFGRPNVRRSLPGLLVLGRLQRLGPALILHAGADGFLLLLFVG